MRLALSISLVLLLGCAPHAALHNSTSGAADSAGEWSAYGRDVLGSRHSPLAQIDTSNVTRLAVAWTYHTGELAPAVQTKRPRSLEATPIVVEGVMYLITPLGRVIALDAETGRERWVYDARLDRSLGFGDHTSRGVSTWLDPSAATGLARAAESSPQRWMRVCSRSTRPRGVRAPISAWTASSICAWGCATGRWRRRTTRRRRRPSS
jgi:glucose dehydrogenase